MSPEDALARTREIALALPGTAERPSHGAPGFHGCGETSVLVKASGVDEQTMLIEADPDTYYRPPYLGPSGWLAIRVAEDPDWDLVADRVARSWELVAPRRLLEAGGR